MTNYEKQKIALRYYLLGIKFHKAVHAMDFALEYHNGLRKDGTAEFSHQVRIGQYLRTISHCFIYPEETFISNFLHDVTEDYAVLIDEIRKKYGDLVADTVNILDKNGKPLNIYFNNIGNHPIASIVKGGDRIDNVQTMIEVFSKEKQRKYLNEVSENFLPMIKNAKRLFPQQEMAYQNIKYLLQSQRELIIHTLKDDVST